MSRPEYPVFDADNHLYESPEVITEYLPERHRREIRFVEIRGRTKIMVKGRLTEFMPNPTFDKVAAPGAHMAFYSGVNPDGLSLQEMSGVPIDCLPEFRAPGPRLEAMDRLGLHRALMFPTLANLLEYSLDGDPDLTHVAVHAVNRWLHDVWSYDYRSRIFTVPVITLPIVEEAIAELEWVLERGAKAILVRPAPAVGLRGSRSIGLPEFDPFWARVQEAEIPVCMHASFPPLVRYYETWEPGRGDSAFKRTPLREVLIGHREIEDALAALVCEGTLSRFPRLKVLSVENGAEWVAHLVSELGSVHRKMPQEFSEHPLDTFRRNVYVNPFWEDDVVALTRLIGADHVLFGSDWPHPEGLAEPLDFVDFLAREHVDADDQRKIMSDNGNRLLGISA